MTGQPPFAASGREPGSPPWIPGFEPGPLLGLGGHADVFCYTQLAPRRLVAVKVSSMAGGAEASARLWREGEIMASLGDHPGVVHVIMSGQAPDGRTMLVLDYCAGPTLADRLHLEVLPVGDVLTVGIRMAEALAAVHAAGIIHRDIKPANILTTSQGHPRLGDFGLAVLVAETTNARAGMSIPWAAPELLKEEPATPASDIYSLAATLYTALARRAPFQAVDGPNSESDVLSRTLRARLTPIGRDDLPAGLEAVLARAMDRNPANRYPDAMSLASALEGVAGYSASGRLADLMAAAPPLAAASPPAQAATGGQASASASAGELDDTRLRLGASLAPDRTLPEALAAALDDFGATRLRGAISLTPENSSAPGISLTPFTSASPATPTGADGPGDLAASGGSGLQPPPPPPPPVGLVAGDPVPVPPEVATPPRPTTSQAAPTAPAPTAPAPPPAPPAPLSASGAHAGRGIPGPGLPGSGLPGSGLPEPGALAPAPPPSNFVVGPISATGPRGSTLPQVATTIEYPPTKSAARAAADTSPWRWIGVAVGAAVVCAAAVGIVWAVIRGGGPQNPAEHTGTPPSDVVLVAVPSPVDLTGSRVADGSVVFWWTNPNPQDGDRFDWSLSGQGQSDMHTMTSQSTVTIPADQADSPTCLEIILVRADGRYSAQPARGCVE